MKKLSCLLFAVSFTAITPAVADQYELGNAAWLAKVCLSTSADGYIMCGQYVSGVEDTYFVLYPNCPRLGGTPFELALEARIKQKLTLVVQQNETQIAAASLVLAAIAELNPCPKAPVTENSKTKNCGDLMTILNNQWANDYVKQATLEAARNRGCLN